MEATVQTVPRQTVLEVIGLELEATVAVPENPLGVVLFVHTLGGSRHDASDAQIAEALNQKRIATVLVSLLTARERALDAQTDPRFDITVLGARVVALVDELAVHGPTAGLRGALCGTGTGTAGALIAAAARPRWAHAVFSLAGRPDLAGEFIRLVRCPTLLVVGETDGALHTVNEQAEAQFPRTARIVRVPGASVAREEPQAITLVTELARDWFSLRLGGRVRTAARH
jgi:predicted alpha/beta-hydrolase family hydrolase